MPRNYSRKPGARRYKDYTEETLLQAVMECKNASYRSVAAKYHIPFRTLFNKVKQFHGKSSGGQTVFNEQEEEAFVTHLLTCATFGMPLETLDLKMIIKEHLNKCGCTVTKFTNNVPGDDWVKSFLLRHKEVAPRLCQNIKRTRAEVNPDNIKAYFDNLKVSLEGVPPSNVLNYDETNLSDEPGVKKCLFRRGVKYPERVMNHSKGNISVMFSGTADGKILPPYVVYKAQNLWRSWCEGGPPGTRYGRSKSGWMDSINFEEWFTTIVVPWARRLSGSKIIIGDNLSSHLSKTVLEKCEVLDIKFVLLPPNSTDKCQPLDVSFFGPMKREWRKVMESHKQKHPTSASLDKSLFPVLLSTLMDNLGMRSTHNIMAGFKACGIYPLDENAVLKKFPMPRASVASPRKVSEAVLQYLQNFKYSPDNQKTPRVCRKKLTVEPGKSISAADLTTTPAAEEEHTAGPSSSGSRETALGNPGEPINTNNTCNRLTKTAGTGFSTSPASSSENPSEVTDDSSSSYFEDSEDEWEPPKKKTQRNIFLDF